MLKDLCLSNDSQMKTDDVILANSNVAPRTDPNFSLLIMLLNPYNTLIICVLLFSYIL